jgi:hypothetical protein
MGDISWRALVRWEHSVDPFAELPKAGLWTRVDYDFGRGGIAIVKDDGRGVDFGRFAFGSALQE